jgi:hypothetical protein
MQLRKIIRFFTLKGLKARAIHIEPESVYGPEALALLTVKKCRSRSHQGRADMADDPKSQRPLTNNLAGGIGSMPEERLFNSCKVSFRHFRIGSATFLPILQDKLGLLNSIFAGCGMPNRSTRRAKECHVRSFF